MSFIAQFKGYQDLVQGALHETTLALYLTVQKNGSDAPPEVLEALKKYAPGKYRQLKEDGYVRD